MARFTEDELNEFRNSIDIVTLIESYGTTLKSRPTANEYVGCCPLHDDQTPSLFVNRAKGLWQCKGACGAGGDAITWVMRAEKVSFIHAIELLKDKKVGLVAGNGTKAAFVRRLENPIEPTAEDHELLYQVAEYYHSQLQSHPIAMEYLKSRGLDNSEAIAKFKIGYSDRSLGRRIPKKQIKSGREQRARLETLGVMKAETGHEALRGCITFPVLMGESQVGEIYGRRATRCAPNERHWYLSGPHVGIWNAEGFQTPSKEIILCESIIDALTFWIAGYKNVTCSYGNQGFTEEIYQAFLKSDIQTCWIAWDNDDKSNPLALQLAARLMMQGIQCVRIVFPKHAKDANEFAMKVKDGNGSAHGSFSMLMRSGQWLLSTDVNLDPSLVPPTKKVATQPYFSAPKVEISTAQSDSLPELPPSQPIVDTSKNLSSLGASGTEVVASQPLPETASIKVPEHGITPTTIDAQITENEVLITIGNRSYRVRGLAKATGYDSLKINLMVRKDERFFIDSLDLYQARQRGHFIKEASREIGIEDDIIKRDLGKVLQKLEQIQDEEILEEATKDKPIEISEEDKARALELLQSENLLDRILMDFDACGVVGERNNKLVAYVAATSRKLAKPLAIMVQSSSAAGKSALMEAVLSFVPEEEQVTYSAMTGQSLFYMGDTNLKHKILAISEEEGVRQASYALKLLQSDGKLTIASTGKNPTNGRMETQNYHVEGPVMLFLTTTAIDIDEELLNRCLVLTVDENSEQTEAIQDQQRERETLEGLIAKKRRESVVALHRNAQRLLRPLAVVNNYAHQLRFLTDQTRRRRDHVKYLTLIQAVTLLHQHQREVKTIDIEGKLIEYIETIPQDIQIANQLSNYVLGRSIDELAPQTKRLLLAMYELVRAECQGQSIEQSEYRFTRRFLRERLKWGATQLRIHLDRLVEMEYVVIHIAGRGKVTQYELLFDGRGREGELTLCGLIDPSTLVDPHARTPEREDSANGSTPTLNLTESVDNLAGLESNLAGAKRPGNGTETDSIGETSPIKTQGQDAVGSESLKNANVEGQEME
jgi:DNA primase catalytic core